MSSCESPRSPDGQHSCCDRHNNPRSQIKKCCPTAAGIRYIGAMNTDMVIIRSVAAVTALGASLAAVSQQATAPALHPTGFHLITL